MKAIQHTAEYKKTPLFLTSEIVKSTSFVKEEPLETIRDYMNRKSVSEYKSKRSRGIGFPLSYGIR